MEVEGDSGDFAILRKDLGRCKALLGLVSADSEPGILRCGLSVLLLRSIAPNHFLFDSVNAFPRLAFPCLSSTDLRRLLQNHTALINEASTAVKKAWFKKLLQAEAEKREALRKTHESDVMEKIEPNTHFSPVPFPSREVAVQEALMSTRPIVGGKPEAHSRSKRGVERNCETTTLKEVEPTKLATKLNSTDSVFLEQLAEAKK
ncbi:unnamed protein product [Hydatigera taeniaeformis]|uniref:PH domain-containing protein n=1 Tax=Hydatigena taeniaeformis TaxID=6205 RepID=A0A0R3XB64_HYDTA|nr:unnamed protein product [Hydatigera taeniaeformis]